MEKTERAEVRPLYQRIYDHLLEAVSSGKLSAGDRVPSEKELCEQFKVSRITSKKALELLSEQGVLVRFPGKGSFVADRDSWQGTRTVPASHAIGFIIPSFSDSFGTKLLCGIEETCAALGYHLILKRSRDMAAEEESAINSLIREGVAGLLMLPVHGEYYNAEILKLILNKKALVFVDRKMRGLAAPSVATDNTAAAELGVEYLLRLGHRNIAYYSGPIQHTSTVEDRRLGFIRALADFGIKYDSSLFCFGLTSIWTYPFFQHDRVVRDVELVKEHLSAHPKVTAAFAAEYAMALIIKSAAEALNRRVPEDFSILCFDAPALSVGRPPFTYLCQDEYTMGRRAVEILHSIITGEDPATVGDIKIPAKLVIGDSVAEAF
jgi:DNA-binding LacI/PurR family transcriptional regulator